MNLRIELTKNEYYEGRKRNAEMLVALLREKGHLITVDTVDKDLGYDYNNIIINVNGKECELFSAVDKNTISVYYDTFMNKEMGSIIHNIENFANSADLI